MAISYLCLTTLTEKYWCEQWLEKKDKTVPTGIGTLIPCP